MNKAGFDRIGDMGFTAQPIYLTDLGNCQPRSALTTETRKGRWRILEYEAEALSGVMLVAGTETGAPSLTYPLRYTGWHAISIGVFGGYYEPNQVLVKLNSDDTFTIMQVPLHQTTPWYRQYHGEPLWELFFKVADLTDKELVLGQVTWGADADKEAHSIQSLECMIAYIKLVPLSEEELSVFNADQKRTDTRRLFTHNDAHIHSQCPRTAEELRRHIEIYRDTDFLRLYWEAGAGDRLNYFSKIAQSPPYSGKGDYGRPGERLHNKSWLSFWKQGIDPFRVALDYAHEIGLEFHAGYRVAGFYYPPPYDYVNQGPSFFKYHPDLRGCTRNGEPSPRLAYTYPEVRKFVISVLCEIAAFPIEGICLQYNRRLPIIDHEPPLLEGFKTEYGLDALQLDERDPRWLKFRSGVLTQFMRDLRQALDHAAQREGRKKRIEVSAIVTNSEEENLYYGLDLETWVAERLVDTLIPYSSYPNFNSNDDSWTDVRAAEFFISLTKGTPCKLALNIMPRHMSAESYRKRAAALYEAGIEYLFFWDGAMERAQNSGAAHVMRRLGHREEIEAWHESGEPSLAIPEMRLLKLGDWDFRYVSPG